MLDFMKKLSPEGRAYYADTVSCLSDSTSHNFELMSHAILTSLKIGKKVPAAYDNLFGIEAMPRKAYWCNFAMVRKEHQGKGIATRLFQMASQEVRLSSRPRCGTLRSTIYDVLCQQHHRQQS